MTRPLRATYRLQLGPGLGFAEAQALLRYLDALGISHLYLSPEWQGQDGSAAVSDACGGEAGLRALADAAHGHDMGLILDVVPSHRGGVRPGDPDVFAATHAKLIELVRDGVADGIYVDRPDGMENPAAWRRDLAASGVSSVWVSKIRPTDTGESLRDGWPTEGTTEGTTDYAFCADLQAVFVDPAGEAPLTQLWAELSGNARPFALQALNEVGDDRGRFSLPVTAFHAGNASRASRFPRNLLATSTHDTKRSGDAQARLGVLAELGEEWTGAVRRWHADNASLRSEGASGPTPAEELLVYQMLICCWPIGMDRLEPYLLKALREAEHGTSWVPQDATHEAGVLDFTRRLLDHGPFRYGFDGWAMRVADAGARAALGQTLLKLTVPGVPTIDQGDETWFLALVDPDGRRMLDWDARASALSSLQDGGPPTREAAKLHLVWRGLGLRRDLPAAFAGSYTPIEAGEHVCAFLRGDDVLVAVALRERVTGSDGWALPSSIGGVWRDELTGAEHELPDHASLTAVLGPDGRALLRRVG